MGDCHGNRYLSLRTVFGVSEFFRAELLALSLGLRKQRQAVILRARRGVSTFLDLAELHAKEVSEPGDERP